MIELFKQKKIPTIYLTVSDFLPAKPFYCAC